MVLFFLGIYFQVNGKTEWTTLVYVQAKNNLSPFALKNFSDMAIIGSNQNASLLVEWYQPGQNGVWRYRVDQGKMVLEECHQTNTDGNSSNDLVDSMSWAVRKYPADKYALVLWDHGIGIIDPHWGVGSNTGSKDRDETFFINSGILNSNPRIQIDGITIDSTVTFTQPIQSSTNYLSPRGILFNEQSRTYMNNQALAQALSTIRTKVLNNKKLDLLGMDACLMAMMEVGYLAHKDVSVMVASQEVELAHGWPYAPVTTLMSTKNTTPHDVAQGIVHSYGEYYKDKIAFFTQSAIDLNQLPIMKDSINRVVQAFNNCLSIDKKNTVHAAQKARQSCVQFSAPAYIDLHSFYVDFQSQIDSIKNVTPRLTNALSKLKQEISLSKGLIEKVVIANTTGKNLVRARGLSIYFPTNGRIDASYNKINFSQDCLWQEFVKSVYS